MATTKNRANARAWGHLEWDLQDRMRKAMRASGKSVADIADILGVNRNTVGNWMSGRTAPSRATLAAWAMATGVPFQWLVTGDMPDGDEPTDIVSVFDARCAIRDSNPEPAGLEHFRRLTIATAA